jgi:hypothetical protein
MESAGTTSSTRSKQRADSGKHGEAVLGRRVAEQATRSQLVELTTDQLIIDGEHVE